MKVIAQTMTSVYNGPMPLPGRESLIATMFVYAAPFDGATDSFEDDERASGRAHAILVFYDLVGMPPPIDYFSERRGLGLFGHQHHLETSFEPEGRMGRRLYIGRQPQVASEGARA